MPRILRINDESGDPIGTARSIVGVAELLFDSRPGVYHIDEISADRLPCGHTSRRWGIAIKRGDSMVSIARELWPRFATLSCESHDTP
jgi:hypothetical protein